MLHTLAVYVMPFLLLAIIMRQHYKRHKIKKRLKRWKNPSKGLWQHSDEFYELQAKLEKL